jgi:hypothetical protein
MDIVLTAGKYVTWGVVSISVTNLLIIVLMVVVFVVALVLPFPTERVRQEDTPPSPESRPDA